MKKHGSGCNKQLHLVVNIYSTGQWRLFLFSGADNRSAVYSVLLYPALGSHSKSTTEDRTAGDRHISTSPLPPWEMFQGQSHESTLCSLSLWPDNGDWWFTDAPWGSAQIATHILLEWGWYIPQHLVYLVTNSWPVWKTQSQSDCRTTWNMLRSCPALRYKGVIWECLPIWNWNTIRGYWVFNPSWPLLSCRSGH